MTRLPPSDLRIALALERIAAAQERIAAAHERAAEHRERIDARVLRAADAQASLVEAMGVDVHGPRDAQVLHLASDENSEDFAGEPGECTYPPSGDASGRGVAP